MGKLLVLAAAFLLLIALAEACLSAGTEEEQRLLRAVLAEERRLRESDSEAALPLTEKVDRLNRLASKVAEAVAYWCPGWNPGKK